jgi:basic membrane protein A
LVLALVAGLAIVAVACGSDDSSDSSGDGGGSTAKSIKAGVVTDIGGLNDRSFNFLANKGRLDAQKQLGIDTRVLISKSNGDYVPNLTSLAQQKYDVIVPVGFLMADATNTVASKLPTSKFAIVDFPAAGLKDKPKNVEGLLFKEQEAGYLAGYAAGLAAQARGGKAVSSVGGQKQPPVDRYIAGYQAGAKAAFPAVMLINGYSQDFSNQAKCKEVALNQIAAGSVVVFQVAGGCGLGALDAAKSANIWGVGVDADQAYLGSYVLTSALKRVDTAVFNSIKDAKGGSFKGGQDAVYGLKDDGVGIGKFSPKAPKSIPAKITAIKAQIVSGKIANIPTTVLK